MEWIDNEKQQLIKDITESVVRSLREDLLREYFGVSRKHFILNSYHLLFPLMEHWCLVRFMKLTNPECETIPHWKNEIGTFMNQISRQHLDGGNKYKTRYKALKEAWNIGNFDVDSNAVYRSIIEKFDKEQIDIGHAEIIHACEDFVKDSLIMIELLAQGNYADMKKYIQSL